MKIVPLPSLGISQNTLKRQKFDCSVDILNPKDGEKNLNRYFKDKSLRCDELGIAKTFVLIDEERTDLIVGYYSSSAGHLKRDDSPNLEIPKWAPPYDIPIFLIGKLAVDSQYHKKGYGKELIHHALSSAIKASEIMGIYAVVVDAIDEDIRGFYMKKFNFLQVAPESNKLYLLISKLPAIEN